jgi:hypothetical protein
MVTPDDGLACAEERLAAKRAAELEEWAKVIERLLPVIAAQLGILWNEVTGSGWPMPSEIQLTSTGTEMTTEEHVVTVETHLRYAKGHLQPSEEHLADAEVHLKLVKAHLAALKVAGLAETGFPEAAVLPPPEPASGEAGAGRAEVTPEERDRSPAARPRARSAQRGRKPGEGVPHPGVGEDWTCPVGKCQDPAAHPLDECEDGEVGSLVVVSADGIVRADRRRPADPEERGPDILLDAKDTRSMAKYLRAGLKSVQEIGGRGGCPVKGQWHGKLKGRQVLGIQVGHAYST